MATGAATICAGFLRRPDQTPVANSCGSRRLSLTGCPRWPTPQSSWAGGVRRGALRASPPPSCGSLGLGSSRCRCARWCGGSSSMRPHLCVQLPNEGRAGHAQGPRRGPRRRVRLARAAVGPGGAVVARSRYSIRQPRKARSCHLAVAGRCWLRVCWVPLRTALAASSAARAAAGPARVVLVSLLSCPVRELSESSLGRCHWPPIPRSGPACVVSGSLRSGLVWVASESCLSGRASVVSVSAAGTDGNSFRFANIESGRAGVVSVSAACGVAGSGSVAKSCVSCWGAWGVRGFEQRWWLCDCRWGSLRDVGGSVVDVLWGVQCVVAVGAFVDLPAVAVDQVVACPACGDEVVDAGRAALGDGVDVVGLAYGEVGAAVEAAAPAGFEDPALGFGGSAAGGGAPDRFAAAVKDHAGDGGVAGEFVEHRLR